MQRNDPTATLNAADRVRLVKLLGMVGSSHDGEALNAARAADKLVRDRALRWADVLDASAADRARLENLATNWRETATACADNGGELLTRWEYRFCRTLPDFSSCSPKQLAVLARLVNRLAAEGVLT